jgi:cGMP-dependent protein kinase
MKRLHIFKQLSELRLLEICKSMKGVEYNEGDVIFNEGSDGDYLYLLYKGKVQAFKGDKYLREIEEGNCFGETSLILNEPHSATIKAIEKCSIFVLSKEDFTKLIEKNIHDHLIKKISLQDDFLTELADLHYIKTLGEGKFGYVTLVQNDKNIYALKAVRKRAVDKQKILINYLKKEKAILLSLDHQFIVKLVKTMKNEEFVFFLMEYVNGISLSKYLSSRAEGNIKNLKETQFYVATLLIIINYLNGKKIAHRDIKPDNIMIDERGYLKLIDFGTAIVLKDFTNTIVGTPHYIAPEVLVGQGYNFSADYWSIGVTAYEIYTGQHPFGYKCKDPLSIYKQILKSTLIYPSGVDEAVQLFITSLLKKKPNERTCNLNQLKDSSLFEGLNFVSLMFTL